MIEVKSTKSGKQDASRRLNPYNFGSGDTTVRSPGILALALAAIATYFSQFLKPEAAPQAEEEANARPDEAAGDQPKEAPKDLGRVYLDSEAYTPMFGNSASAPSAEGDAARGSRIYFPKIDVGAGWFNASVEVMHNKIDFAILPERPVNVDRPPMAGGGRPGHGGKGNHDNANDGSNDDSGGQDSDGPSTPDAPTDGGRHNRAPHRRGPVQLNDIAVCPAFFITADMLLEGASDPDGDALFVTNLEASSGRLTPTEGGWLYEPDGEVIGPVVFSYDISDGVDSIAQTAHIDVQPHLVEGTAESDILVGSACADDIDGQSGDDNIVGREGNDTIRGGDGDDNIVGGDGNDTILAGAGDDIVFGGRGNDTIFGGEGNDRLFGDEGNDIIRGDAGDDMIDGGTGDDVLFGGEGNDEITDGAGADAVDAGAGDDIVLAAADGSADSFRGGDGDDTLDFSAEARDLSITVNVDSGQGTSSPDGVTQDSFTGFETLVGGDGNDTFIITGLAEAEGGMPGASVLETAADPEEQDGEREDVAADDDVFAPEQVADPLHAGDAEGIDNSAAPSEQPFDLADVVLSLRGGGGQNTFDFSALGASHDHSLRRVDIQDFKTGDHIRTKLFDIFAEPDEDDGEKLAKLLRGYDEDGKHGETLKLEHIFDDDEHAFTVVSIDHDLDDMFDTDIFLHGNLHLTFHQMPWT